MRLNHLNLCVEDLAVAEVFLRTHVGFRLLDQKGETLAVLTDGWVVGQFESSRATISSMVQRWSAMPAATAGVVLSVLCTRAKL